MAAGLVAQYAVVSLAVVASAGFVVRKQWPAGVRRMRLSFAVPLVRASRPAWMQRVGKMIAPRAQAGGAGCDTGCDGCSPH